MGIRIMVAMARNGAIGFKNRLPWYIPEDLRHFRELTMGKTLVMGRKTFQSILKNNKGKPLDGRNHIVLSTSDPCDEYLDMDNVIFVKDFKDILKQSLNRDLYIIGGSEIYGLFSKYTDKLIITYIDRTYTADAFFPDIDWDNFRTQSKEFLTDDVYVYKATRKHRLDKYFE